MPRMQVVFNFPYGSLLPGDEVINTWAFESSSPVPVTDEIDAINAGCFAFYSAIAGNISDVIAWNTATARVRFYNIDNPEPRVPFFDEWGPSPFAGEGNDPLPDECACALSFHGLYVSGQPQARRRGRVFLGPLAQVATTTAANGHVYIHPNFITAIGEGVQALWDEVDGSGAIHSVWSRADDEFYNVVDYSVDNAVDVQRRRGPAAAFRTGVNPTQLS